VAQFGDDQKFVRLIGYDANDTTKKVEIEIDLTIGKMTGKYNGKNSYSIDLITGNF
jgi:hypothetical protein